MGWRALLLLAVACAAEEEHFIDVKQIVKGTIEAVAKLPMTPNDTDLDREKKPEEFYKLFQLPADIMTKLAADAGYIETPQTTTGAPWIVRRKVHRSSEDEQSFTQYESEEKEEKPRKKKKYYKSDPTLIAISDLLPKVEKPSQIPIVPLQPAPGTTSLTNSVNLRTLPVVQSATDLSHSNVQPQYAYQPIVQPDGKTYYQQVLILPGQVVASKDGLPRLETSPFVQEKPRTVLQADYTVAPPTFPPPVDVFRRESIVETSPPPVRSETATRPSVYPSRFIRPSNNAAQVQARETFSRIQVPQSDPIAIPSSHRPVPTTFRAERQYVPPPKESLFSTKLPSGEEQMNSARVFQEEAAVPPKPMKATQASPLRIRTIDTHLETATAAEEEQMSTLKRGEELKKVMEQHRREVDAGSRKRKLRKAKKSKKWSKKNKSLEDDSTEMPSSEKAAEEYRKAVRRMPSTQFLERVPILTPPAMRKRERAYASKTWKKRRYEPVEMVIPKDLESFEEKTGATEEDATEPPRKRRKLRKSGKSRKAIVYLQNDVTNVKQVPIMNLQEPQQEPATSAPLKRKVLRLGKFREIPEANKMGSEERGGDSRSDRPKKLKRTKRVKKTKSSTSHSNSNMPPSMVPLRQHCLNIRTFARQFGINDVDEFSRDHCAFIENYYPHLTCERRQQYVAECSKYY